MKTFAQIDPPLRERPNDDDPATFLPMERVSSRGGFDGSIERRWGEAGTYTPFERGDVLLAKITPCFENGKATELGDLPTLVGFGSTEFIVLRPRHGTDPKYLFRLIHLDGFRRFGITAMKGSAGQQRVPPGFVANAVIPLPPPDEQAAIVRFLDHAVGRLDRAIAAKRRVVRFLEEQRRAVVHRAVTRGLDPSAHMVDSGVPWLGEVPEGWEVRRLKHVVGPVDQGWSPQCEATPVAEGEWGVLKVGCVNSSVFAYDQNKRLPGHLSPRPSSRIREGDIVVSRANTPDLVGLAAYVDRNGSFLMLSDKHYRFQARQELACGRFLVACLRSGPSRSQLEGQRSGASGSMQNISKDVLMNLLVALPSKDTQEAIIKAITRLSEPLDSSSAAIAHEIALLEEYRTALVSEVVTGRRDVRAVAASLPEPPPPAGDAEELDAGEDDLKDALMEEALA